MNNEKPTVGELDPAIYLRGAACGLGAVTIWAGWMAVTRLGVTSNLSVWDITALRFAVAGLLLLPVILRRGLGLTQLGWQGLIVMVAGAGAPYALVAGTGLRFASAAHAGVLIPGVMPLFVAGLSALILREALSARRLVGFALILAGVLVIAGFELMRESGSQSFGHALFLTAAFMWACFTIAMRRAALDPLHAAAVVSVVSCVIYLPPYFAFAGASIIAVPWTEILGQAVYQGAATTVLALFLYARAIAILGASSGAAFGALAPALAALLAIPVLGELPSRLDWIGIFTVSVGVYLASGGPLPRPWFSRSRATSPGAGPRRTGR